MRISIDTLFNALDKWVTSELIGQGSVLQQGLVTFIWSQGRNNIKNNLMPYLTMLTDKDNSFDYAELNDNLGKALNKMGGSYLIPLIEYRLDRTDIDKIMSYTREIVASENR